jgi:hypothetical protein
MAHLKSFINNPEFSDVLFIVGSEKQHMHGHQVILASSDIFRAMFSGSFRESYTSSNDEQHEYNGTSRPRSTVEIPNISPHIFLQVLEEIYTGHTTCTLANVVELFLAASQYMLNNLRARCVEFTRLEVGNMSHEMFWDSLDTCVALHADSMTAELLHALNAHHLQSGEYLHRTKATILAVLQSEHHDNEFNLFCCAANWAYHQSYCCGDATGDGDDATGGGDATGDDDDDDDDDATGGGDDATGGGDADDGSDASDLCCCATSYGHLPSLTQQQAQALRRSIADLLPLFRFASMSSDELVQIECLDIVPAEYLMRAYRELLRPTIETKQPLPGHQIAHRCCHIIPGSVIVCKVPTNRSNNAFFFGPTGLCSIKLEQLDKKEQWRLHLATTAGIAPWSRVDVRVGILDPSSSNTYYSQYRFSKGTFSSTASVLLINGPVRPKKSRLAEAYVEIRLPDSCIALPSSNR